MGRFCCALLLLPLLRSGVFGKVCPEETFSPDQGRSCKRCSVCDRTLVYKQKCTEDADAVCECAPGYSCGENCKACDCVPGKQRTVTGCEDCPEKTFNDQPTGHCRPWWKCPGDKIREPGTKKRDVVCWTGSESPPTSQPPPTSLSVYSTKMADQGNQLILISTAFFIIILLFAIFMLLAYIFLRSWIQKRFRKPFHGQLAQEVDDCVYRYPEEEEGGSCEAASALQGELLEKYYTEDI